MSCYLRHLTTMFETLGLAYDRPNRQRVDRAIREILGLPDEPCGTVWAALKALPEEERLDLAGRVAERL